MAKRKQQMPGNMGNMMKQVQKMQSQMQKTQEEIENKEFTASAGGGASLLKSMVKKRCLALK